MAHLTPEQVGRLKGVMESKTLQRYLYGPEALPPMRNVERVAVSVALRSDPAAYYPVLGEPWGPYAVTKPNVAQPARGRCASFHR